MCSSITDWHYDNKLKLIKNKITQLNIYYNICFIDIKFNAADNRKVLNMFNVYIIYSRYTIVTIHNSSINNALHNVSIVVFNTILLTLP